MVALLIKALNWRQPRCLVTMELINKSQYIHTMEDDRAIRINIIRVCNNVEESPKYKFEQKKKPHTKEPICLIPFI